VNSGIGADIGANLARPKEYKGQSGRGILAIGDIRIPLQIFLTKLFL
tara:strand:- start:210 stop:350 length:141 start_codon:yes stop_codon:yes gene_type:complete